MPAADVEPREPARFRCALCGEDLPREEAFTLGHGGIPGAPMAAWHGDCQAKDDAFDGFVQLAGGTSYEVHRIVCCGFFAVLTTRGRDRVVAGPAWWALVDEVAGPIHAECGCGARYTRTQFRALPYLGRQDDGQGGAFPLRNCTECPSEHKSTISPLDGAVLTEEDFQPAPRLTGDRTLEARCAR
jgi:hypothetical protein